MKITTTVQPSELHDNTEISKGDDSSPIHTWSKKLKIQENKNRKEKKKKNIHIELPSLTRHMLSVLLRMPESFLVLGEMRDQEYIVMISAYLSGSCENRLESCIDGPDMIKCMKNEKLSSGGTMHGS